MDVVDEEMMPGLHTETVDPSTIVKTWLQKFKEGAMTTVEITEHWRVYVPRIYTPSLNENCLNWSFDEEMARNILFNTLEEFICDGDSAIALGRLSQMDKPPSVCGRVFKMGEPTYSCRECGMDNTCVLCVDCFKNSEHRFHKYKMGTSGGGGCCDCGDVEAWKKAPFCDIHAAGVKTTTEKTIDLPEDLKARTKIIFHAVLWYAYDLMSVNEIDNLRCNLINDNYFNTDLHCTILYNDEIHTFEQVIGTLTRVKLCNQRTAVEFVTNIDREGRAVVKCSTFDDCTDLKHEIEKHTSRHGNRALKVSVSHAHNIAHQIYAMKLLNWLQNFLGHGEGFRSIFAQVALESQPPEQSIIKGILLRDSTLWKSARSQWQRLLISGMLLEYENKKELAILFTRNYGAVIKDFIKDDHDHSYSISSLSVQLFTVPTLAHYLIANCDVLYILLNTFMSECSVKCNKAGKLEFERSPSSHSFKRAQYMLYDLRYLLNAIPENWTDGMRRNFLHGMTIMLNLLTKMQGMDAVTRQVGQHMEYEPEWESAFNLHIKLAYCISLMIKWCSTDKIVLVKTYRYVLKNLEEIESTDMLEVNELVDHSASCLVYDVASKPISIHLPLTRFLAGIHLNLDKFNLHYDSTEFLLNKPTPVQIMEPVLRCQVLIAQVHAGMWRRNGYALLNQLYYYHNVKCRTEMLDRDITLLQMCASLIESNEFLIHLLSKYNLMNWASTSFETITIKSPEEDSMRQTVSLVEEFLRLLIVIIGERYIPGVSTVNVTDRIKKEIIQYLSIKPLPHSELNKIIPDDIAHETALDDVIEELATFKKPTQTSGKGVYELKEQFYDEYNVFFYHYTREELSKSEEAQRKRRKKAGELECCPPPKLPKLNESFNMLVNLLQCDVMLHIMQTILERCNNLRARSFSELQLHKVLHLIGYALLEEESNNYPFFKFIQNSTKFRILQLMSDLLESPRVDAHKGLLKWTLRKYREVANQKENNENPSLSSSSSSTSVLPIEQNSQEQPNQQNPTKIIDNEKEKRAKLAAERRAKIMAQISTMQKNFMKDNAKLFEESNLDIKQSNRCDSAMDISENVINDEQPIALGPNQTTRIYNEQTYTCILCQEEETIKTDGSTLVLAAFVQQATVLCQHKNNETLMDITKHDPLYLHSNLGPAPHTSTCGHVMHADCWRKYFDNVMLREHRRPYRMRHPASFDVDKQEFLCPLCECLSNTVLPLVPPLVVYQTATIKSCLTYNEWLNFIDIILMKKTKMCHGVFKCNLSECTNMHCSACINAATNIETESLLSVCEANCMSQQHQVLYSFSLDMINNQYNIMSDDDEDDDDDDDDDDNKQSKIKENKNINENNKYHEYRQLFSRTCPYLNNNLRETIQLFAQATYTRGLNVPPHPYDKRLAPIVWKSLSYTIHAIEVLLRDSNKPLFGNLSSRQRDCIESLIRIVSVLGSTWHNSVTVNNYAIQLLIMLFEHKNDGPSLLHWDSLGFLIPLTFALPSISCREQPTFIPNGGTLELYTLRTIFIAHIVKILILMNIDEMKNSVMDTDTINNDNDFNDIINILNIMKINTNGLNGSIIWKYVQNACLPFLRCCCLFYHYLTDVPTPIVLHDINGNTFENLCKYLDLPQHPRDLFNSERIFQLIQKWTSHEEILLYFNGTPLQIVHEPLSVNRLIDLPNDYSELINTVSTFTCPNSDEVSRNPTMCLVCGEILCSQTYCCQTEINKANVGACNYHAYKCGAGVGLFLRVRECEVLFLAAPHRGCFVSAPYVDDYGETDQGLRRGNPLRLCPIRYKKLHSLWLSHSIHEEIARAIEASSHIIATQWNHL